MIAPNPATNMKGTMYASGLSEPIPSATQAKKEDKHKKKIDMPTFTIMCFINYL